MAIPIPKKLITISEFGGIKNDNDPKLIDPKYSRSITNWNFPDDGTVGLTTIKMPEVSLQLPSGYATDGNTGTQASPGTDVLYNFTGTEDVDGIIEYDFIDSLNISHSYYAIVSEGILFFYNKDWTAPGLFKDAVHTSPINYAPLRITAGKVSMKVYQNNLYISNGIDYPVIFYGSLYQSISQSSASIIGATATADSGTASNLTSNPPTAWSSATTLADHWWKVDIGETLSTGILSIQGSAGISLSIYDQTCTADSSDASYPVSNLNTNPQGTWRSLQNNSDHWCQWDLGASMSGVVISISITAVLSQRSGDVFVTYGQVTKLQASTDGSSWTDIQTLITGHTSKSYSGDVTVTGSYRYFRFYSTYYNPDPSFWVSGGYMRISSLAITKIYSQETILQGSDNDSTWYNLQTLLSSGSSTITFDVDYVISTGYRYFRVYSTFDLTGIHSTFPVVLSTFTLQNSYNYIYLTAPMGAPLPVKPITGSQSATTYKYIMTFVTAGGEEVVGCESIGTNYKETTTAGLKLYLPFGYSGTLTRKLYRTKIGDFETFYHLADIADNTTQYYSDVTEDAGLGSALSTSVNNELPRPYFMATANGCLYAAKNDLHPTQVYKTDVGNQVLDSANYIEISDMADDNSPVEGIGADFSTVIVGTSKNMYFLTPNESDSTATDVTPTRSFCGVKDGNTMKYLPSFGDFPGGLMFVSSNNEIRIMVGMQALPVSTSIDNVRTQNYGQNIKGDLLQVLPSYSNIYAEAFDNKYHLIVDGIIYVFDSRCQAWTKHYIRTTNYTFTPLVLGILNTGTLDIPNYQLFSGNADGEIEQLYVTTDGTYKTEAVNNTKLISGYINASASYKQYEKIRFWFKTTSDTGATITVRVTLDDNINTAIVKSFTFSSPVFDPEYYDYDYFATERPLDFETTNINLQGRWMKYSITCTSGNISLQRVELIGQQISSEG